MKVFAYTESGSGSINGVAPKGSIFANNILLIIELPAIEAASPALKPGQGEISIGSHVKENLVRIFRTNLKAWFSVPALLINKN